MLSLAALLPCGHLTSHVHPKRHTLAYICLPSSHTPTTAKSSITPTLHLYQAIHQAAAAQSPLTQQLHLSCAICFPGQITWKLYRQSDCFLFSVPHLPSPYTCTLVMPPSIVRNAIPISSGSQLLTLERPAYYNSLCNLSLLPTDK